MPYSSYFLGNRYNVISQFLIDVSFPISTSFKVGLQILLSEPSGSEVTQNSLGSVNEGFLVE